MQVPPAVVGRNLGSDTSISLWPNVSDPIWPDLYGKARQASALAQFWRNMTRLIPAYHAVFRC